MPQTVLVLLCQHVVAPKGLPHFSCARSRVSYLFISSWDVCMPHSLPLCWCVILCIISLPSHTLSLSLSLSLSPFLYFFLYVCVSQTRISFPVCRHPHTLFCMLWYAKSLTRLFLHHNYTGFVIVARIKKKNLLLLKQSKSNDVFDSFIKLMKDFFSLRIKPLGLSAICK